MKKDTYIKILIISISIIVLLLIALTIGLNKNNSTNNTLENSYTNINRNEIEYQNNVSVDELKEKSGLQADSDLYEIQTEGDGKKVLVIKPDLQYKVAFAGIIKKKAPTLEETNVLFEGNYPSEDGIWVAPSSRANFLTLLKGITTSEYGINENGYVKIEFLNEPNEIDTVIQELIMADKKTIITINSNYYKVDTVSGQIISYPFEELDNLQVCEKLENNTDKMIVITANSQNKLTNEEIVSELFQSTENQ